MAHYMRYEEGFEFVKTGTQAIDPDDNDMLYRSVTMSSTKDTLELADAGDEIVGSITGFSRDQKQVRIGIESHGLQFRNSGATAIAVGSKIVGATRTVVSTVQYGYVAAFGSDAAGNTEANIEAAINAAVKAKGIVRDGGGVYAADAEAKGDVIVQFPA